MGMAFWLKLIFELPAILKMVQEIIAMVKRLFGDGSQAVIVSEGDRASLYNKVCELEKCIDKAKPKPKDVLK